MPSKISVIIPTIPGREDMLKRLLDSLPSYCEKIVVPDEGMSLAAKRNKGARQAEGAYLLFIDDDNYLKMDALQRMMEAYDELFGVMGIMACYDDKPLVVADGGSLRWYLPSVMDGVNTNKRIYDIDLNVYEVDEVANAFMIPRRVFELAGGFDEDNFPIDLDEADICKRIKDMGYLIVMNPKAICYHKSQTYSYIPDFRRPMNAYFMGRNRVLYQKKHLNPLKYLTYLMVFMPPFVAFYCLSLLYRRKPGMILHFLKGVLHGLQGRRQNQYF